MCPLQAGCVPVRDAAGAGGGSLMERGECEGCYGMASALPGSWASQ